MRYIFSIVLALILLFSSISFAQNSAQSNLIAGYNSSALKDFRFDLFQHPALILLRTDEDTYSLKAKTYETAEDNLVPQSFDKITQSFASSQQPVLGDAVFMDKKNAQFTFLLMNDAQETQWVLDLNHSLFLPQPSYKNIAIYNALTQKKILEFQPNQTKHRLSLPKNKPFILTISFEQIASDWGTYAPKIYAAGSPHDLGVSLDQMLLIVLGLLIFLLSLIFLYYIELSIALPACIGWAVFATSIVLNTHLMTLGSTFITPFLWFLWVPLCVLAQRFWLYKHQAPPIVFFLNFAALLCAIALVGSAGLALSSYAPTHIKIITFSCLVLSSLLSCLSGLFCTLSNPLRTIFLPFIGWTCLLIGALITASAIVGFIPPSGFSTQAYYTSSLLLGVFWTLGLLEELKSKISKPTVHQQKDSGQTRLVERLQETREGFDNKRLTQVLKRERDIMKILREKDIQLTEDMKKAKEKADYANHAKSAFLAVISHEIRTPMTGIMGMVRLLRGTSLAPEQEDHVDTISDSGDAMMALLNDILDYEKIDTGKMELENIEFDLYKLLQNVQSLMVGRTQDNNVELRLEISDDMPQHLYGDPTRLRQILLNLISNALKFTKEGHVSIQVRVLEHKNASYYLYFAIQDTGLGIPKAAQKDLFDPFIQADSTTSRKYGGSGLGLAICKKLVNAMGGDISINSAPDEGSTFFFSITMRAGKKNDPNIRIPDVSPKFIEKETKKKEKIVEKKPETKPEEKNARDSESLTLMVVDDNAINQKVVAGLIAPFGHTTTPFMSGQDAIDALQDNPSHYDLILMDIEMPVMNGIETTSFIRNELKIDKNTLPIVALTGSTADNEIASYFEAGMTGFLAKPIEADKLESMLDQAKAGAPLPPPTKIENDEEKSTHTPKPEGFIELPVEKDSHLEIDEEYTPPKPEKKKGEEYKRTVSLADMDTGLSIDETEEEKEEEDSYNPADFDSSTLLSLKEKINPEELTQMIEELVQKMHEIFQQIAVSIQEENIDLVRARLHDLKGMAGNFGLVGLGSRIMLLENALQSGAVSQDVLNTFKTQLAHDIQHARIFLDGWT